LEERPGGERCPLRATSRNPVADARKLFQGDPATGAFRDGNDPFLSVIETTETPMRRITRAS